jgi:hypothetical protein
VHPCKGQKCDAATIARQTWSAPTAAAAAPQSRAFAAGVHLTSVVPVLPRIRYCFRSPSDATKQQQQKQKRSLFWPPTFQIFQYFPGVVSTTHQVTQLKRLQCKAKAKASLQAGVCFE